MILPTLNVKLFLFVAFTFFLVSGLYGPFTTALPTSSLARSGGCSQIVSTRQAASENPPERAPSPRALAKRGLAPGFIVLIVIVAVVVLGGGAVVSAAISGLPPNEIGCYWTKVVGIIARYWASRAGSQVLESTVKQYQLHLPLHLALPTVKSNAKHIKSHSLPVALSQIQSIEMDFRVQFSSLQLLLITALLLICGLHPVVTSAHRLASRAELGSDSVSLQKRASNFDRATQLANVTRALAKRDITMAHWILIGIILMVACSFIYWWKCVRPRKLAQQQGDDEEDPKKKSRLGQLLKVLI
ncbi:hypothetical protein V8E51_009559 [Hyaloscypha variabilis]